MRQEPNPPKNPKTGRRRTPVATRPPKIKRRTHAEISDATEQYRAMLWYVCHRRWAEKVMAGEVKIVDRIPTSAPAEYYDTHVCRETWEGALAAAARHENAYGFDQQYPWDEYDVGMASGKLSALRWVLGDEWDFLDL